MKLLPRVAAAIVGLNLALNLTLIGAGPALHVGPGRNPGAQQRAALGAVPGDGERHEHEAWQARYDDRRAPRGYEWRYYDGRYVLVALATGLIVEGLLYGR